MTDRRSSEGEHATTGGGEIRPVGTWVICGLVLFVCLANWILVAVILAHQA